MDKKLSQSDVFTLIALNEQERIECEIAKKRMREKHSATSHEFNRHEFYQQVLFDDMLKDGYVMTYPHGRVIKQANRKYHYRGENAIFSTSQPTFIRKIANLNAEEKEVEEVVAHLRYAEFICILQKLEHLQKFQSIGFSTPDKKLINLDILYPNIAQHYGFDTNWLDITSDFDVALFFACCTYRSNQWQPLTQKDFSKNEQSKYGRIFRRNGNDLRNMLFPEDKYVVFPVGFQPLMRCHMQYSYAMAMDESMDLLNPESGFECLIFEQTEDISSYIFNKMGKGKLIYPHEGLNIFEKEIDTIKHSKCFSKEAFNTTNDLLNIKNTEPGIMKLLEKYGYKINKSPIVIEQSKIKLVNEIYRDFDVEKSYGIKLSTRFTYMPEVGFNLV